MLKGDNFSRRYHCAYNALEYRSSEISGCWKLYYKYFYMDGEQMWMHKSKIWSGEGLLKWHVWLTPMGVRSQIETMTKSQWLTEVGQERERLITVISEECDKTSKISTHLRRTHKMWGGASKLVPEMPTQLPCYLWEIYEVASWDRQDTLRYLKCH